MIGARGTVTDGGVALHIGCGKLNLGLHEPSPPAGLSCAGSSPVAVLPPAVVSADMVEIRIVEISSVDSQQAVKPSRGENISTRPIENPTNKIYFPAARIMTNLSNLGLIIFIGWQSGSEVGPAVALINLFLSVCVNTPLVASGWLSTAVAQRKARAMKPEKKISDLASVSEFDVEKKLANDILPNALFYTEIIAGLFPFISLLWSKEIIGGLFEESKAIANFASHFLRPFAINLLLQQATYTLQRFLLGISKNAPILVSTVFQIICLALSSVLFSYAGFSPESAVGWSYPISSFLTLLGLSIYMKLTMQIDWLSMMVRKFSTLSCCVKADSQGRPLLPETPSNTPPIWDFSTHGTRQAIQSGSEFLGLFVLTFIVSKLPNGKSWVAGFQYPLSIYNFMSLLQFVFGQGAGVDLSKVWGLSNKLLKQEKLTSEQVREISGNMTEIYLGSKKMIQYGFRSAIFFAIIFAVTSSWYVPQLLSLNTEAQNKTYVNLGGALLMQILDAPFTQLNVALGSLNETKWPSFISFLFRAAIPLCCDGMIYAAMPNSECAVYLMWIVHIGCLLPGYKILSATLVDTLNAEINLAGDKSKAGAKEGTVNISTTESSGDSFHSDGSDESDNGASQPMLAISWSMFFRRLFHFSDPIFSMQPAERVKPR